MIYYHPHCISPEGGYVSKWVLALTAYFFLCANRRRGLAYIRCSPSDPPYGRHQQYCNTLWNHVWLIGRKDKVSLIGRKEQVSLIGRKETVSLIGRKETKIADWEEGRSFADWEADKFRWLGGEGFADWEEKVSTSQTYNKNKLYKNILESYKNIYGGPNWRT